MRIWLQIAIALTLDGAMGLAGGVIPERWLKKRLDALVAFATGALLGAVFLDALPDALESAGSKVLVWALVSLLLLLGIDEITAAQEPDAPTYSAVVLGSDMLHNLGDGATIAAAFLLSEHGGWAVAIAVLAHELPKEIGDYALLRAARMRRTRALAGLFVAQLSAFAGAVAVMVGAAWFNSLAGCVLGFASGTFLYLALHPIPVHTSRSPRLIRILSLSAGAGLMVATTAL